jgi:peptidoglycan/xylan/chitin deacetylase (PgdA/CDA1 family)
LPDRKEIVAAFTGRRPRTWGLEPPGVDLALPRGTRAIALTFDCCGGPGGDGFDRSLLAALEGHGVSATFFLNARWVRSNRDLTRDLAANPLFDIANHGTAHLPLSVTGRSAYGIAGTADAGMVYDEIMVAQAELTAATGKAPRFFRSGTAHYDDVSVQICRALGLVPVNFTVNGDGGATYPAPAVTGEFLAARPGNIILAHANQPEAETGAGVAAALPRMIARGTKFIRLSDAPPA